MQFHIFEPRIEQQEPVQIRLPPELQIDRQKSQIAPKKVFIKVRTIVDQKVKPSIHLLDQSVRLKNSIDRVNMTNSWSYL